jgi:hypothetical protein
MYATVTKPLTFEEFLTWDDGSGRDFELLDGVPVPLCESFPVRLGSKIL